MRGRPLTGALAAALVLLSTSLFVSAEALAYRQTKTCYAPEEQSDYVSLPPQRFCPPGMFGRPIRWPTSRVSYVLGEGFPKELRQGQTTALSAQALGQMQLAMNEWNSPNCSDFLYVFEGLSPLREHKSQDRINVIAFDDAFLKTYATSSGSIAITFTTSNVKTGEILDADIIFNSQEFTFLLEQPASADEDTPAPAPSEEEADLRSVLVHEAGHMLGLDHSGVVGSTMWAEHLGGETYKKDLHGDDVSGLCAVYPVGLDLLRSEGDDAGEGEGCCATYPAKRPLPLHMIWVGILCGLAGARRWALKPERQA